MSDKTVGKLEAARRQLDAAIRLYLDRDDQLPIHTLAMAAFRVLCDLSEVHSDESLRELVLSAIRPGKKREFWKALRAPSNFLKHADKDSNELMAEVSEDTNGHIIFLACMLFVRMATGSPEIRLFIQLHLTTIPDLLIDGCIDESDEQWGEIFQVTRASFRGVSRGEQLDTARTVLQVMKSTGAN